MFDFMSKKSFVNDSTYEHIRIHYDPTIWSKEHDTFDVAGKQSAIKYVGQDSESIDVTLPDEYTGSFYGGMFECLSSKHIKLEPGKYTKAHSAFGSGCIGVEGMFANCPNLESIDLSAFNFSRLQLCLVPCYRGGLSKIVMNCPKLERIDLGFIHGSNMDYMFDHEKDSKNQPKYMQPVQQFSDIHELMTNNPSIKYVTFAVDHEYLYGTDQIMENIPEMTNTSNVKFKLQPLTFSRDMSKNIAFRDADTGEIMVAEIGRYGYDDVRYESAYFHDYEFEAEITGADEYKRPVYDAADFNSFGRSLGIVSLLDYAKMDYDAFVSQVTTDFTIEIQAAPSYTPQEATKQPSKYESLMIQKDKMDRVEDVPVTGLQAEV